MTGKDIKNHSIAAADLSRSLAGAPGPAGPRGVTAYSLGTTAVQPVDADLPEWQRTKVAELTINPPEGVKKLQIDAPVTWVSNGAGATIVDCEQCGYGSATTVTLPLGRMESGGITGVHTLSVYCTVGTGDNGASAFARISVVGTA